MTDDSLKAYLAARDRLANEKVEIEQRLRQINDVLGESPRVTTKVARRRRRAGARRGKARKTAVVRVAAKAPPARKKAKPSPKPAKAKRRVSPALRKKLSALAKARWAAAKAAGRKAL